MKKIFICFSCAFVLLMSACSAGYERSNNPGSLVSVKMEEVRDMMEKKETFALMFTQTNCSHCIDFLEGVLSDYISDHELVMYDVVFDKLDSMDDVYKFIEEHPNPKRFLGEGMDETSAYTPSFYFIEDGEVKDIYIGQMDERTLDGFVKQYRLDEVKK